MGSCLQRSLLLVIFIRVNIFESTVDSIEQMDGNKTNAKRKLRSSSLKLLTNLFKIHFVSRVPDGSQHIISLY